MKMDIESEFENNNDNEENKTDKMYKNAVAEKEDLSEPIHIPVKSNKEMFYDLMNTETATITNDWRKMNKSTKLSKLFQFAEQYKITNSLSEEEHSILVQFLKDSVDKKKLVSTKDIIFDKNSQKVLGIPGIVYIKSKKHFTFRTNNDKRVSTLKSLGPKKNVTKENI